MGLKRRNPARTRLFTPPQMLAAMAFSAAGQANEQEQPAASQHPVAAPAAPAISTEERHRMIAGAAYARAERAGFRRDPLSNWLDAEREIDALLARKAS